MPVIADPEHWTFRASETITEHGQAYEVSCQGQVQWDRTFYLYNVVAKGNQEGEADPRKTIRYTMECITKVRQYAREFGWKKLLWTRERDGETHVVPSGSSLDDAIRYLESEAANAGRVFQATANTAISMLAALKKMPRGEPE